LLDPVSLAEAEAAPGAPSGGLPLHSAESLRLAILARRSELRACGEETQSELAGQVLLSLEIDESGQVLGGATTPAGGEEGLAAVADCMLALARSWRFPSRSRPGRTILRVPFVVSGSR
jgi:hypothetical protein